MGRSRLPELLLLLCVVAVAMGLFFQYDAARKAGVPTTNMLVYTGESAGQSFLKNHAPAADLILCDPSADISVRMLGGSDATCWLVIDGQGKLAWRGSADPARISELLGAL